MTGFALEQARMQFEEARKAIQEGGLGKIRNGDGGSRHQLAGPATR